MSWSKDSFFHLMFVWLWNHYVCIELTSNFFFFIMSWSKDPFFHLMFVWLWNQYVCVEMTFNFFWVVADFFLLQGWIYQCLAIAVGNFFFFGFILMCCNLIALETKLLCLLSVIICDIKNKIRNNRQVPTYFMDLCSFQVFFLILFFIFYG